MRKEDAIKSCSRTETKYNSISNGMALTSQQEKEAQ